MRDKVFTIRLSDEESKRLAQLAKKYNLKRSEMIRALINEDLTPEISDEKIAELIDKSFKSCVK